MKKKTLLITLILILFLSINVNAGSSKNLTINSNNTNIVVNQEFNGDYYLPLRDVVENLGGNIFFDNSTSSIIFSLDSKYFVYYIKTKELEYRNDEVIHSYTNNFDIKIENGKSLASLSFLHKFLDVSYEKTSEELRLSTREKLANNFHIKPLLIAHGGGEIHNIPITNSLEAIENSIKSGSRLIELDFLKTSDNKFILGHDWGHASKFFYIPRFVAEYENYLASANKSFDSLGYVEYRKKYGKHIPVKYDEYVTESNAPLTPVRMGELINILEENKDLSIVTDVKEDNEEFLLQIFNDYKPYMYQFIPQVYSIDEYYFAKSLGFKDIIYSMYKVYLTDDQIVNFAKNNDLYAITMAESRAGSGLAKRLSDLWIMTYVHTINDMDLVNKYTELGVSGFYTDRLY